jgi:hypothetical protein
MPGTHLLPPNLLKLFSPRPPLPYTRPLDRDIDRVRSKHVSGVAGLLASLKEETESAEAAAGVVEGALSRSTMKAAKEAKDGEEGEDGEEREDMEEGEEPTFTLAEEYKRQMRREERKKAKADKFKALKDTCGCCVSVCCLAGLLICVQINRRTTQRLSATLTRPSSSHAWYSRHPFTTIFLRRTNNPLSTAQNMHRKRPPARV